MTLKEAEKSNVIFDCNFLIDFQIPNHPIKQLNAEAE